jgi:outer membrane protein OmpA-like peptidoglycan-associated protein/membrane-bound metal-dependent hydrolase YbcI (DUF457 family)
MFIGHYALAFGAKKVAPSVSLGTAFMACQFADLLWPTFLTLGLEVVEIDPGNTLMTPLNFVSYPYSHSLVMLVVWSALFALVYRTIRGWNRIAIVTVAALVFSHYVLDVITHRPDLPITIAGSRRLGLGLWNYPGVTLSLEIALFLAGTALYTSVTRARGWHRARRVVGADRRAGRDLFCCAVWAAAAKRGVDRRRRTPVVVIRRLGLLGRPASKGADCYHQNMKMLAVLASIALMTAQPLPIVFPPPAPHVEAIGVRDDYPFLPPLAGARLIQTSRVALPLELKSATADDEAVLAGMTHLKKTYERAGAISSARFVNTYRDALFAAGWKVIDVTKIAEPVIQPETVTVSAQYHENGRNLYARMSLEPDGPYEINVADVGAEDWAASLARECRVRIYSIHFDLDRASIRTFESEPTLQKLSALLKTKSAPPVEIQGHMDNIGPAGSAARQTLSEARAKAVAAWLTTHGVAANKVTAKGYGKARPVAENDSDLGRAFNRRIEIVRRDCAR